MRNLEIPWALDFAPDGRIFLTERPGRIRIVRDGRLDPRPWATLPVAHVGEGGLLGLALSPEFSRTSYVYVYYTYQRDSQLWNRVVRLVERGGQGVVDRVIIDGIPGAFVHDGGRIKFGPDGKLYVTTGDARNPSLAQDRTSLAGKILRVNPDGSIPTDNPFPGSPVYSYGHRNPQGLAWHPETGALYATEHGPSGERGLCCHDEVNLVQKGKNYGWPEVVGYSQDQRFVSPILESQNDTWAPSGAAFATRGVWRGTLFFTALRGQALHRVTLQNGGQRVGRHDELYRGRFGRLRDVVEGPDGALYVLTSNRDGRGAPAPDDDRLLRIRLPSR
ncbi:MAG: PQQ-dependent sugar dehydrogenase [Armatimonadota bacterium]|nr:PQQ-dependent sugar dehydrogenase [Armatimonadota bacterium]MDR5704282.1 PQQ-dependent sugar dehydrogenase [Armatimonadota bacterium]MDR7435820.1 PQQ-dependent sugar dehydrogenase [Armatimonadota bacterium]